MKKEFYALYDMMAISNKVEFMHIFGKVHKEMMGWFIQNKPELAQEWLDKLEAIRWKNYLSPSEAEKIVSEMKPQAPWTREQWNVAMEKSGLEKEERPCYNKCALYVTMNMIMSDSSATLTKFIGNGDLFKFVHALSVDKLKDEDGRFKIREYFGV